jgi:heme/copper-type cytochrome/quinol oxidase subunit 3
VLWLAVLLFGAHAGASLYEMLVVTPLWASDPPRSVREWGLLAQADLRPMAYKEPALLALGCVSMAVLWLSSAGKTAARGWMVLSGVLGIVFVAATMLFSFPIFEHIKNGGAGLTDLQIIETVNKWNLWCDARIVMLLSTWVASLVALIRSSSRPKGESFS